MFFKRQRARAIDPAKAVWPDKFSLEVPAGWRWSLSDRGVMEIVNARDQQEAMHLSSYTRRAEGNPDKQKAGDLAAAALKGIVASRGGRIQADQIVLQPEAIEIAGTPAITFGFDEQPNSADGLSWRIWAFLAGDQGIVITYHHRARAGSLTREQQDAVVQSFAWL
jgi:hypothetical protein